jgi:hypothetical protein
MCQPIYNKYPENASSSKIKREEAQRCTSVELSASEATGHEGEMRWISSKCCIVSTADYTAAARCGDIDTLVGVTDV